MVEEIDFYLVTVCLLIGMFIGAAATVAIFKSNENRVDAPLVMEDTYDFYVGETVKIPKNTTHSPDISCLESALGEGYSFKEREKDVVILKTSGNNEAFFSDTLKNCIKPNTVEVEVDMS